MKYQAFVKWCLDNGMKWTGVDFPAVFENGLRGIVATRDIKPYEAIIFIPNSLLISVKSCLQDKFISSVVEKFPDIFKDPTEGEYSILILFMIRERMKGKIIFPANNKARGAFGMTISTWCQ